MRKFLLFVEQNNFFGRNSFFENLRNIAQAEMWGDSHGSKIANWSGPSKQDSSWKIGFDHVIKEIYADTVENARIMADNIILDAMSKHTMPTGVNTSLMEISMEVNCNLLETWFKHSKVKA